MKEQRERQLVPFDLRQKELATLTYLLWKLNRTCQNAWLQLTPSVHMYKQESSNEATYCNSDNVDYVNKWVLALHKWELVLHHCSKVTSMNEYYGLNCVKRDSYYSVTTRICPWDFVVPRMAERDCWLIINGKKVPRNAARGAYGHATKLLCATPLDKIVYVTDGY